MYKYILLIMIMIACISVSSAQNNLINDKFGLMTFEKVDMDKKLITFDGKTYKYKMLGIENAYYETDRLDKNLKYMRKGEKFYVNIYYNNMKSKSDNDETGIVNYVGKVEYAF